ncbi:hypothetical protein BVRB_2g033890 [Beta vulgaris subsp. vulgaris]|nr:hypothetical protein BVRB_2g033890 [Beta vulgaris subsp. vulgaris]
MSCYKNASARVRRRIELSSSHSESSYPAFVVVLPRARCCMHLDVAFFVSLTSFLFMILILLKISISGFFYA